MAWSNIFRGKSQSEPKETALNLTLLADAGGLRFISSSGVRGWIDAPSAQGTDLELALYLRQLIDEGFAVQGCDEVLLSWDGYYALARNPEHSASITLLRLPSMVAWRPRLVSKGTITDTHFAISVESWLDPNGNAPPGNVKLTGGLFEVQGKSSTLPEACWRLAEGIRDMRARNARGGTPDGNRRDWAKLRELALAAQADMADFLKKTIVLTPERLRIGMRKADVGGDMLVEIIPGFDGAPDRWMEFFDRFPQVPERYEIPDGQGLVQIILPEESRAVLSEIRRMPGRRVVGDRAQAFVRNPFAALGPDASKVINPEQFEKARDDAGVSFARFTTQVQRDAKGYPYEMALMVEESIGGEVRSDKLRFEGARDAEKFIAKLEARIEASAQCCHWQGYDLEILGDTLDQLETLREALRDMSAPEAIKASEVFDISKYSDRIEGFGVEKPYYSPFIARKSEDSGWFPENVDFGLCYTPEAGGETIAIVLNEDSLAAFRNEVSKAQDEKRETFYFPGCPKPVPVKWANEALEAIGNARAQVSRREFDPSKPATHVKAAERRGLVVKPNVDTLDYVERRGTLAPPGNPPKLPASLRVEIALKEHQLSGVSWLQHLWSLSPKACRGALLADDMGLGKTIQLLTFIATAIEEKPDIDPFLIVAPVSLLENWKEEVAKFFAPDAMRVLTLYGPTLAEKRVPKRALEDALIKGGATRLLTSDWLGGAQVVLTTYETLRDLEFSLAAQRWSAMICDEAQKIKNPNALVTRAAKKQNARFKIACTGTPVENTLTDIWCLFDFVQPGLLGALKEFGNRYRRPIEAETDEEKERVAELRALIEPQKLRRTKAEVAKDLPKKIEVNSCRALPLSDRQRAHYADAISAFRNRDKSGSASGLQSPLGLLQYLRRLCSDPRPPGHVSTDSEPLADIEGRSPKMAWLMGQLREIKAKEEKVIVFCEFRDLQRTLQRCIGERFGVVPDVINGDTSADSANANNRQRRIQKFQEKPGFGVIVLSPLAVGFGVNIQAANHVVHFTRTWNPAKEDQATDRAYRIGQTKDVHVYYPVVVAHDFLTFDAKLDKLLDWKRGLSTDMLNGSGDVSPADFGDLEAPDGGNAFGNELLGADDIQSMDSDALEALCALLWSKKGYPRTIKTPRSGDGGIDVVAIKGNEGVVIQCKSSSMEGRELGWDAVKDVAAGVGAYAQRHPGVSFSMIAATNQRFNGTARRQAEILHVELVDGEDLESLLAKHPVKRGELERFLLANWIAA